MKYIWLILIKIGIRFLKEDINTVYKRFNIHEIEDGYEYDEEQYGMVEYLRDALPQMQLAIAELSALIGGDSNV